MTQKHKNLAHINQNIQYGTIYHLKLTLPTNKLSNPNATYSSQLDHPWLMLWTDSDER